MTVRVEELEAHIDSQLTELARIVAAQDDVGWPWNFNRAWALLRVAYAKGFTDAMESPDPESLYLKYGFKPPEKKGK